MLHPPPSEGAFPEAVRLPVPETLYRNALESLPCGAFVCDARGIFRLVNPAYERLTGYSAAELVGCRSFESLHDPAELARRRGQLLSRPELAGTALAGGPFGADLGPDSDWIYVQRNNTRIHVSLALSQLKDTLGQPAGYVGVVFDNTRRARHEARLWYLSYHDPLTGLPNQSQLEEHLGLTIQRRRASGEPVLLTFLEIDNLRKLYDTLGQPAAEVAVRQIAQRLREACESHQMLCLVGGTQFAIVSAGTARLEPQREAALLAAASEPIDYLRTALHLTASIGSSAFPDSGDEPGTLMRRAQLALSAARTEGGNCARHFDFSMQTRSAHRLDIEVLLREALAKQQFWLAFQPQVNLATGRIMLAESLLRWRHPVRGAIGPAEFIPVAEEMGLILPIGEWVLQNACRQAARMVSKFGTAPRIAVNVSPVQFRRQDVLGVVRQALDAAALDPRHLEIEITEGVLLNDTEHAVATLSGLREMGVEIAIDDFGTGYSSLSYLTRFQVDRIKIDRSLVNAMTSVRNGDAIVSAIIAMAHALDIRVTAEGVETQAQAERLRALGCDEAQGYWFSRPLTPQALENTLAPVGA
ncbi:hypothetical protein GCM10023144_40500 [Pigmentiphaga soli]|uniref:EAL domain-containing protein n=1 Tax=Pigmentiphaga soli TaxID=1007095 RepID=A0ABP8HLJ9_9BURK